jgi:hypothetical protein
MVDSLQNITIMENRSEKLKNLLYEDIIKTRAAENKIKISPRNWAAEGQIISILAMIIGDKSCGI